MSCPVALLVYETQFLIGPEFAYSARLVDQEALELLLSVPSLYWDNIHYSSRDLELTGTVRE